MNHRNNRLLSSKDMAHVMRHWRSLEPQQHTLTEIWFCHFFELVPQALDLFPFRCCELHQLWQNRSFQAHGKKVNALLAQALEMLNSNRADNTAEAEDELARQLQQLGKRHAYYPGMTRQYFAPMASSILYALERCSSSSSTKQVPWTPTLKAAWTTLIGFVGLNMSKGMAGLQPFQSITPRTTARSSGFSSSSSSSNTTSTTRPAYGDTPPRNATQGTVSNSIKDGRLPPNRRRDKHRPGNRDNEQAKHHQPPPACGDGWLTRARHRWVRRKSCH
mmetsp:Transcript_22554/g.49179  ORF Transcript_22554/g.49179 Transcript_22554/m.49179 type:complete len:276 (-) Transcript_22554:268-1095(-)